MTNANYNLPSADVKKALKVAKLYYKAQLPIDFESIVKYCNDKSASIDFARIILAYCTQLQAIDNSISTIEYLHNYAMFKLWARKVLNDFGALNDLYEILACVAIRKNFNLITIKNLHVKSAKAVDVTIKGVKFEIATNGKTWTQSTIKDAMNGNFDGVIYGTIDDETSAFILSALMNYDIKTAVNTFAECCGIWFNKYQFLNDINNLTRGNGVVFKAHIGYAQTVYNESKNKAFIKALNDGLFERLSTEYHI